MDHRLGRLDRFVMCGRDSTARRTAPMGAMLVIPPRAGSTTGSAWSAAT